MSDIYQNSNNIIERPHCRQFIMKLLENGNTLEDIIKKNCEQVYITNNIRKQAVKMFSELYPKKKLQNRIYHRAYYHKTRLEILKHYGGEHPCCELINKYPDTCGADCLDLLTIDHEGGEGINHHREINRGNIYYWLKKNDFPKGHIDKNGVFHRFRLLCHNCNHLERLRVQKEKDELFKNMLKNQK